MAKLALVTSKDEEEDDFERGGGTDSSHSTDATLVDESTQPVIGSPSTPSSIVAAPPVAATPSTILGKRPRVLLRKKHDQLVMEPESLIVDEDGEKDFVLVSKINSSSEPVAGGTGPQPGTSTMPSNAMVIVGEPERDHEGDIEMVDGTGAGQSAGSTSTKGGKAPPLPPRPRTQTTSGSDMMFGERLSCLFSFRACLIMSINRQAT